MKSIRFLPILVLALAAISYAETPRSRNYATFNFKQTVLKNGLRVITLEDHSAPVVSLEAFYAVGSIHETKGQSGIAHLLEHVTNFDAAVTDDVVVRIGGSISASTGGMLTDYFEIFPSNQLELALFLESQRMRRFGVSKEVLEREKKVVLEEGKQRNENTPYGADNALLTDLMFDNFLLGNINDKADLDRMSVQDLEGFYRVHYSPNNAVLVLVGDFETGKAFKRIKELFEEIPRKPKPPAVDISEPEQTAERRMTRVSPLARAARINVGYKTVRGMPPDFYALHVLSFVLGKGRGSRLHKRLVNEKAIAVSVNASSDWRGSLWENSLIITTTMRSGAKTEDAESEQIGEIERLKREPITPAELQRAKDLAEREFISDTMSDMRGRAFNIGSFAVTFSDPHLINTWLDKLDVVTVNDVMRAANTYLKTANRSVLITVPGN